MEYWKQIISNAVTFLLNKDMEFWKDFSSVIESFTMSIGVFIAGVWTYLLFVRQRLNYPKVNIDLSVENILLPGSFRLIHVSVSINNVGSVILHSNCAELRIRQVAPVPDEIKTIINDGKDPVVEGKTEIAWPMLHGREWQWEKGSFEIEPGESDSLHADFIINDNIESVEFYFFISNSKKKRVDLGWTRTQICKFHSEEENKMVEKTTKTIAINNQQERQQKQQQKQKPEKPPEKKNQKKRNKKSYNLFFHRTPNRWRL